LADQKGYSFIGCNLTRHNAYFIRNDKMKGLGKISMEDGFIKATKQEG
jgi:hypothetical protein